MHVSHSKMATVVDYDMSANEFLAGLPPQVCPPHSSSAWGVEKCADIKTRGFATVQTQWHSSSGRWCEGGAVRRAAVRSLRNAISPPCFPDMSASPMARAATQGQDIPTRRVVITSEEDMPAGLQLCLCMTHSVFYLKLYFTASYINTLPSKTKKLCVSMCTLRTGDKCAVQSVKLLAPT